MAHRTTVLIAVVLLSLAQGGTAVAGGWATTRIDDQPARFAANTTYEIRYTILQHGKTPIEVELTSIVFTPADTGGPLTFPGVQTGSPGQYVAEVNLPKGGAWSWEVSQGWFGMQQLGTVHVRQAQGSVGSVTLDEVLRVGLPLATLIAFAVFAAQVLAYRRHRSETDLSVDVD